MATHVTRNLRFTDAGPTATAEEVVGTGVEGVEVELDGVGVEVELDGVGVEEGDFSNKRRLILRRYFEFIE